MNFGTKLRLEREARSLTRESLSAASGVPFGTIHGYEIGRRSPTFANVVKLAKALGVDCTAFSGCDDITDEPVAPAPKPSPRPRGKRKKA